MERTRASGAARAAVLAVCSILVVACSNTTAGHPSAGSTDVGGTGTAATGSAAAHPISRTGNATHNSACSLLRVDEIETQTGAHVQQINGLSRPGSFAKVAQDCSFFLDATTIGIPSVLVGTEVGIGHWRDDVVKVYRQNITSQRATVIPNLGGVAVVEGRTAEVVIRFDIVRVAVTMHEPPTAKDKAIAIAFLRLVLQRLHLYP